MRHIDVSNQEVKKLLALTIKPDKPFSVQHQVWICEFHSIKHHLWVKMKPFNKTHIKQQKVAFVIDWMSSFLKFFISTNTIKSWNTANVCELFIDDIE